MKKKEVEIGDMRQLAKLKPLRLEGCMRVLAVRPGGGKQREFRLCSTGGAGHPTALQVMSPHKGRSDDAYEFIVGSTQKACRLTWPGVYYAEDLGPEAQAGIRNLSGAGKKRRR